METITNFWSQLIISVESFISEKWTDFKNDALDDSTKFLTDAKDDIQRWTSLLAEGKLTADDLLWLIKGKRDAAELLFLKQKGLTKPDLDKFFEGLLQTIISTALKTIV